MVGRTGKLAAITLVAIGLSTGGGINGVNLPQTGWIMPAAAQASRSLIDPPSNFQEVPAPLQVFLSQGASNIVKSHFGDDVGSVRNFFAFLNYSTFTMVMGFTVDLPDQTYVSKFDAGLRQPRALEEMNAAVRQSASFLGPVTIQEQRVLDGLSTGIGERSTGMGIVANARGMPLYVDTVSFRRGRVGAVSLVGSLNARSKSMSIAEVARQMDTRLQQSQ